MDIVEFAEKICEENGYGKLSEFEKSIIRAISDMRDRPPIILQRDGRFIHIPYDTKETVILEANTHRVAPSVSYKISRTRKTVIPLTHSKKECCDGFRVKLAICDEFENY